MKIVQIGSSGHFAYALKSAKKYGCDFVAIAMGDSEEEYTCKKQLNDNGFDPKLYSDAMEMLEKEDYDIVVINSCMGYNAKFTIKALELGKHVFVEKPVATELSDLKKVIDVYKKASENNICLCAMFGILDEPHFYTARKIVESGTLGEIRLVNAQKSYRLGTREPFYSNRNLFGGTIPWVAIHAIDWSFRFSKIKPVNVTASHSTIGNNGNGSLETSTFCMFTGSNGEVVSVSADYLRPRKAPTHDDDRVRLVGLNGILEVLDRKVSLINSDGKNEVELLIPNEDIFEGFIRKILYNEKCYVDAEDSFYSTYLALMARESADKNTTLTLDFDYFCGKK